MWQADEIGKARAAGAVGVKILKTLGLYSARRRPCRHTRSRRRCAIRSDVGRVRPAGDPCGHARRRPGSVLCSNRSVQQRYEELGAHPDWSFYGKDFPAFKDILDARDRVFARHPKTTFVALHVGHWAENLAAVGRMLDKFPNVHVEIGARIGELGRQPRTSARFFDRPGSGVVRNGRDSARRRNAATGLR